MKYKDFRFCSDCGIELNEHEEFFCDECLDLEEDRMFLEEEIELDVSDIYPNP